MRRKIFPAITHQILILKICHRNCRNFCSLSVFTLLWISLSPLRNLHSLHWKFPESFYISFISPSFFLFRFVVLYYYFWLQHVLLNYAKQSEIIFAHWSMKGSPGFPSPNSLDHVVKKRKKRELPGDVKCSGSLNALWLSVSIQFRYENIISEWFFILSHGQYVIRGPIL